MLAALGAFKAEGLGDDGDGERAQFAGERCDDGRGTGTGAAPVIASLARELGALTVAIVTKPFGFEGTKRRQQAEQGLAELAGVVDTVITIPNDQLLDLVPQGASFFEAFRVADDVLRQAVAGISDIITTPGIVNRDFADIRAIMTGMGYAMMGTASARGENACVTAAREAISSPMMETGGVRGARGMLINITGSSKLGLHEVNAACTLAREAAGNDDVQISFGVVLNEELGDEVKVTVIATGFLRENLPRIERRSARAPEAVAAPVYQPPVVEEREPEPAPEPAAVVSGEPPAMTMAAAAAVTSAPGLTPAPISTPAPSEPLFDDLEIPAILRSRRRGLVQ